MLTSNRQLLINVTEWSDVLGKYFYKVAIQFCYLIGSLIQRLTLQDPINLKLEKTQNHTVLNIIVLLKYVFCCISPEAPFNPLSVTAHPSVKTKGKMTIMVRCI